MKTIKQKLMKKLKGVTAIEYGLIAALVPVVIIAALTGMGEQLGELFTYIADQIDAVLS
jgi:pilus assembly protein Flp/PilA